MMTKMILTISISLCVSFTALSFSYPKEVKSDREQIIDHLHSIFKAFINQDINTIRATHSRDWTGFQSGSRVIIKGIDGYMKGITLKFTKMEEYEIKDIDVQVYGEIGIVYYVARWKTRIQATGQLMEINARACDIYRKESGSWIQAGSNLNLLPRPGALRSPDCGKCLDVNPISEDK